MRMSKEELLQELLLPDDERRQNLYVELLKIEVDAILVKNTPKGHETGDFFARKIRVCMCFRGLGKLLKEAKKHNVTIHGSNEPEDYCDSYDSEQEPIVIKKHWVAIKKLRPEYGGSYLYPGDRLWNL